MPASQREQQKWSFWIDRGGTFTDIIATSPSGKVTAHKLLSENKAHYDDAALHAIRDILGLASHEPIAPGTVGEIKLGTTVATNALLEHKGEPTLLLTSKGLGDCLEIGTQARPDIFALKIVKPKMLYTYVAEIEERVLANGEIDTPLNIEPTKDILNHFFNKGLRSIAILFMHSYKFPEHEHKVAEIARSIGFTQVSCSHEVSPLIKYVPRGDTTIADAYLTPVLNHYTKYLSQSLETERTGIDLKFMTSSGGLIDASGFRGKNAILSGPAGGIVGAAKTAAQAGYNQIVSFDMGGTSTDVSHFAGNYDIRFETEIAGCRLQSPMLHIETVAAGGGSILTYKNGRMAVGPESAGADPGPMAYRKNGPLTVTDANLMTGRIIPELFPAIFGDGQNESLDLANVKKAFAARAKEIGSGLDAAQCANGYLEIANENMAAAIKKISIARGIDIKDYTLVAFGGAGGQHAAKIAESLGISRVFVPPHSGLLSAYGIGLASESRRNSEMIARPLKEIPIGELETICAALEDKGSAALQKHPTSTSCICYLNYLGSDTKLPVHFTTLKEMNKEFSAAHLRQFGFLQQNTPLILEQIEVTVESRSPTPAIKPPAHTIELESKPPLQTEIFDNDKWHNAEIYREEDIKSNAQIKGPALITSPHQTVYVPPKWTLRKQASAQLIIERQMIATTANKLETPQSPDTIGFDPIRLELFNNLFMSIAEQMGEALRGAARSVNIKERLDFSCALFDAKGELIANAPHVPVHLGSMDSAVKSIIEANDNTFKQGDAFMTNAPYKGGTHLPDITVITPVFHTDELFAFLASRGHHADIGGTTPGSMSPIATSIDEEGILIDNFKLLESGEFNDQELFSLLMNNPYPARNPAQNIADLKAQLAANAKGSAELTAAIAEHGAEMIEQYMHYAIERAEIAVRNLIKTIEPAEFAVEMDQGTKICVKLIPDHTNETLTIDFTGTSEQTSTNFNAPEPVTRAAVLYVIRTLINEDIPMNAGCLNPVQIIIPSKSLLKPESPAAVVAGNVETSQVITNCLYGAFGSLGMAQGTMNNLTFGDETHQYYETICSGSPAGNGFNGASAVHTHMTNSRLTDPEILEERYPVLLREFKINTDSGGKGKWHAGDGVKRTFEFLQALKVAILSGYRVLAPSGVAGGDPGQSGENHLKTADGREIVLPGCVEQDVQKGDQLTIITPTGGGFGRKTP